MATISLDYDGTFTLLPDHFTVFVKSLRKAGHKVFLITMRYPAEAVPNEVHELVDRVIYTNRKAKVPFCQEHGIKIDIWIDDSPKWLMWDSA